MVRASSRTRIGVTQTEMTERFDADDQVVQLEPFLSDVLAKSSCS